MLIIQIDGHEPLHMLKVYAQLLNDLVYSAEPENNVDTLPNKVVNLPVGVPTSVAAFTQGDSIPQPPVTQNVAHIPQPPAAPAFDPATQTVIPGPLVAGVEVDSKGHVWDGRIHAATRAKVADGTWRMKRGIDDATVAAVRAEHAQTQAAPAVSPGMFERAAQPAPAAAFGNPTAVPPPPPVAPTVSTGTIPTTATSLGEPPRLTFPELMRKITAGYAAQKIDKGSVDGALAQLGLPSLPMLATRPDLLHPMASLLGIAS